MEYLHRMRAKIGTEQILIPATALVILNENQELLLHLRNDSLTWGFPGGLMDTGETVLQSLHREAQEETGLIIYNPQFFGIFSGPKFETQYSNGDQTAPVIMGFFTNKYSGKIIESEESPQIDFFSLQNLPKPMNKYHQYFLEAFVQFRNTGLPVIN